MSRLHVTKSCETQISKTSSPVDETSAPVLRTSAAVASDYGREPEGIDGQKALRKARDALIEYISSAWR